MGDCGAGVRHTCRLVVPPLFTGRQFVWADTVCCAEKAQKVSTAIKIYSNDVRFIEIVATIHYVGENVNSIAIERRCF